MTVFPGPFSCAAQEHWSCGSADEFNGRLTFVTVTHVDDLFYAYDTRCKTTKVLLEAIVKEFNMSRKQDDFVFCEVFVLHPARQSRICGLIPCSDGIVWTSAICRNHVDLQRTQRISQFAGKTPMVATSITSRSVIRSESCRTTFQCTHDRRCSSTQCNFSQGPAILGNHPEISTRSNRCVHGSAGDEWRCLFCFHGRFEVPVRCHRVFDA